LGRTKSMAMSAVGKNEGADKNRVSPMVR